MRSLFLNLSSFIFIVLYGVQDVHAQNFERQLNIGVEVESTDNVREATENEESDTVYSLVGDIAFRKHKPNYMAEINYNSAISKYEKDSFAKRQSTVGRASLMLRSDDNKYGWLFSNEEDDTRVSPIDPDTPDNRSQRSVFSTGPIINFNITKRDVIRISGVHTKINVENSTADAEVNLANASWAHRFSRKLDLALQGSYSVVKPEVFFVADERVDEFVQQSANASLTRRILIGSFQVGAGYSRVEDLLNSDNNRISLPTYTLAINLEGVLGNFDMNFDRAMEQGNRFGDPDAVIDGLGGGVPVGSEPPVLGNQDFALEQRDNARLTYVLPHIVGRGIWSVNYNYQQNKNQVESRETKAYSYGVDYSLRFSNNKNVRVSFQRSSTSDTPLGVKETRGGKRIQLQYVANVGGRSTLNCGFSRAIRERGANLESSTNTIRCGISYSKW